MLSLPERSFYFDSLDWIETKTTPEEKNSFSRISISAGVSLSNSEVQSMSFVANPTKTPLFVSISTSGTIRNKSDNLGNVQSRHCVSTFSHLLDPHRDPDSALNEPPRYFEATWQRVRHVNAQHILDDNDSSLEVHPVPIAAMHTTVPTLTLTRTLT